MTTIRVLVEERALAPGLKTEHGLSLFLETGGGSWLFDTGQSDAAVLNSRQLGLDLGLIEGIIFSHGHYDHTGGLLAALAVSGPKTIYAHPGIFRRRFNLKKNRPDRSIGFPHKKSAVMARGGSFDFNRGWRQIADHIFLSGEIPLVTDFEKGEPHLAVREKWKYIPDTFVDEQYLVIENNDGLIMVNGCCHSGLINSLGHLRVYRPKTKIKAIIGGFHLRSAESAALDKIVSALKEFDPEFIGAGHCTGRRAEAALSDVFKSRFQQLRAGLTLKF